MFEKLGIPEDMAALLDNLAVSLVILLAGWMVIRLILRIVRKTLEKSTLDQVLYHFILKIIKIVLWVLLILMVLERFGFKASSLLTVLAAAGAAIALALKDSLANVAGGIMIMVNKPFIQDDYVDINGNMGKVKKIDLFVTHLHTYDNKVITIPNGMINTSVLINYTKEDIRRVDCKFGVGYDADLEEVKAILKDIVASSDMMFSDPQPRIGVAEHGENCVYMDVLVWCSTDNYWDVKYYLEEEVKLAFDKAGIAIPYPQMDVHIVSNNSK